MPKTPSWVNRSNPDFVKNQEPRLYKTGVDEAPPEIAENMQTTSDVPVPVPVHYSLIQNWDETKHLYPVGVPVLVTRQVEGESTTKAGVPGYPHLLFFGVKNTEDLSIVSITNLRTGRNIIWPEVENVCQKVGYETVPVLFYGPFNVAVVESFGTGIVIEHNSEMYGRILSARG